MAGIYGVLLKNLRVQKIYQKFYNSDFDQIISEEIQYKNFLFGRSVLDKFKNDRFLYESESFIVCCEGVHYSKIRKPEDFIKTYLEKGKEFINEIKGSFCGFIVDKQKEKVLIFNDLFSTRVLYYYFHPQNGFAFASEMHVLTKVIRASGISLTPDSDGIYSVSLYGQTFLNFTLIKEVKKLNYGSTASFNWLKNSFQEEHYFRFRREVKRKSLKDIVEKIDYLLLRAVQKEWEKDLNNGYEHFGLISGGMDSRTNMLLAKYMGFKNIHAYTYGNPDSSDVRIAQKIGSENFSFHRQFNLFNGKFLKNSVLDDYVRATDGLTYFTPNAVIVNAMKQLNFQNMGVLHSGQMGDTSTGSNHRPEFDFENKIDKIGVTNFVNQKHILPKLGFLKEIIERYNHTDFDLFAFEQTQVNGILMGDKVFNNFIDLVSPFYDKQFLELMLSVPSEYKKNQLIYFEWLKVKHPQILKYQWERIGMRPNSRIKWSYGRVIRKYVNGAKKISGLKYDSMHPIAIWTKEDPSILQHFQLLFDTHIELIEDKEVRQDLTDVYKDTIFEHRNKFSVLTALLGLKMHMFEKF